MPIGAYAHIVDSQLHLQGMLASDDGSRISRADLNGSADKPEDVGRALAEIVLRQSRAQAQHARTSRTSGPLAGRKILVTRPRDQAAPFADKLRAAGGEPVLLPTIDVAPLDDYAELDHALCDVDRFDWVVFTSANGVRAVRGRLREIGRDMSGFRVTRLAAIGPATARELEALGQTVDFVPSEYLGEAIGAEMPAKPGERALLLRADIASDVLARKLTERGVQVDNVDAYRTVKPPAEMLDLTGIDAVTFTSSSTVRNYLAMQPSAASLEHLAVFCIGPVTAQTAAELGLHVDGVADEHTIDGLIRTMIEFYRSPASKTRGRS